jgi:proline dehydrogenase
VLDRIIAKALPLVPRGFVRRVAGRYIAGETAGDAIGAAKRLGALGFVTTIDQLGEDVVRIEQARAAADGYVALMHAVAAAGVARNVSIKLSQVGLRLDRARAVGELARVLETAAELDFFVRLDMEDSATTDATLEIHDDARRLWPRVGVVLQARLKRTERDARALAASGANVRLCKGIYPESAALAYRGKEEIRIAYAEALGTLLSGGAYVGVATHDRPLIAEAERIVAKRGVGRERYEFQALLGVPMRAELERLRDAGNTVRLYVPFGEDWYAYSARRLAENPSMAGAIAASLLKRDRLDAGGRT